MSERLSVLVKKREGQARIAPQDIKQAFKTKERTLVATRINRTGNQIVILTRRMKNVFISISMIFKNRIRDLR